MAEAKCSQRVTKGESKISHPQKVFDWRTKQEFSITLCKRLLGFLARRGKREMDILSRGRNRSKKTSEKWKGQKRQNREDRVVNR